MTSETEYLSAKDWTKTQHEKYWNIEYYQTFDEETQTSIMDPDKKYERSLTMTFDEDFPINMKRYGTNGEPGICLSGQVRTTSRGLSGME